MGARQSSCQQERSKQRDAEPLSPAEPYRLPCTACLPPPPCLQGGEYQVTGDVKDIFPDFVKMAAAFNVPAKRVQHPSELR